MTTTNIVHGPDLLTLTRRKLDERRSLTYADAIREAILQEMSRDPSVVLLEIGVDASDKAMAAERRWDVPSDDDGTLGAVTVGMALAGRRPLQVHARPSRLGSWVEHVVRAVDQVRSMCGRSTSLPIVIRALVGEVSGERGDRHDSVLAPLMRASGLKIVAPTTPRDAKGALIGAIRGTDPVLFLEHRALEGHVGPVSQESTPIPLDRARLLAEGSEITLVGISSTTVECLRARKLLSEAGISCEVIDLLSLNPLDASTIAESVEKTGRLLVVDDGSTYSGAGTELLSRMTERFEGRQGVALHGVGNAPAACPVPRNRADDAFATATGIASRAYAIVTHDPSIWMPSAKGAGVMDFSGSL